MRKALPFITIPVLLFVSCISIAQITADQKDMTGEAKAASTSDIDDLPDVQELLLEGAMYFLGTTEIAYLGRRFPYDCSGLVMGIYYYAGIDLQAMMKDLRGNAVSMIHQVLDAKGLITDAKVPEPGDIIFWDNTYDLNGDGLWNDSLTHTGMVVSVSKGGTIEYIHLNYRRGVVVERMNLNQPDVQQRTMEGIPVVINSHMRMAGQPTGKGWLSSHLFRDFGKGWAMD